MNTHVRSQPDPHPARQGPASDEAEPRQAAPDPAELLDLLLQVRAWVARIEEMVAARQRVRDYYSTAEVAEILGRAEFTVREWCRLGRVRAEKKRSGRGKHPAWVIADAELRRIQREGLLPV